MAVRGDTVASKSAVQKTKNEASFSLVFSCYFLY